MKANTKATQSTGEVYQQVLQEHDKYLDILGGFLQDKDSEKNLSLTDKIDRVAFHIIEEIIELRRTYPHKYWKKTKEEINFEEMLEETTDVFLMTRAMILIVCRVHNITESEFLNAVLSKINKNKGRIKNGY